MADALRIEPSLLKISSSILPVGVAVDLPTLSRNRNLDGDCIFSIAC
jgi:hypothetical protein